MICLLHQLHMHKCIVQSCEVVKLFTWLVSEFLKNATTTFMLLCGQVWMSLESILILSKVDLEQLKDVGTTAACKTCKDFVVVTFRKKCNLYQFRADDNSTCTSANHIAVLSWKTFAFWRQKYKFVHVSNMLKWDILGLKFYFYLFSNSWCEIKSFQKVKKWQWYSAIYV